MKADEREVEIIIEDLKAGVLRNKKTNNFPGVRERQQLLDKIFEEQSKIKKVESPFTFIEKTENNVEHVFGHNEIERSIGRGAIIKRDSVSL